MNDLNINSQAKRLFDEGNAEDAASLLRMHRTDPICLANLAILHDRKHEPQEALKHLPKLMLASVRSGPYWYAVACLAHKLNRFQDSLDAANKATAYLSSDTQEFVDSHVQLAYSLEGLGKYEEAIEAFENLLLKFQRQVEFYGLRAEIQHGLGHFYTELAGLSGSFQDIRRGRYFMELAANAQSMYMTCLGTIYCETREYDRAVRIFTHALAINEVRTNVHLTNEILFYEADALTWLGKIEESKKLFEQFEEYALNYNYADGIAHSKLYQIAHQLRTTTIVAMELEALASLRKMLEDHQPTPYATPSFHKYWARLDGILEFLIELKNLVDGKTTVERMDELIGLADRACKDLPTLIVVTNLDESAFRSLCAEAQPILPLRFLRGPEDMDPDVVLNKCTVGVGLAIWQDRIPAEHAVFVTRLGDYVWIGVELNGVIPTLLRPSLYLFRDPRIALRDAEVLAVFDRIRFELTEPFFLTGLTPTTAAPTFSAQSRTVEFLIDQAIAS